MNAKARSLPVLLVSVLLGLACFGFVLGAGLAKDSIYKYLNVFAEVYSLVRGNYVDPVDEDGLLSGAYKGMVGGLDLFSGYLTKEEFQKVKSDPLGGPAETGLEVLRIPGGAVVVAVAAGSPAEKAGIRPSDQIWSIEGVPARHLSLIQLRRSQRGADDSVVRMLVYHPKTQKREDLRVRRTMAGYAPFESRLLEGKVGYLKIADLERTAKDPLKSALSALKQKGATRLLLDLRGCVKGSVEDVVRVAGLLLPPGPVVSIQERGGTKSSRETKSQQSWSLPVYVLHNGGSAGGSEILAAALRARLKAPLLGEASYGWGSAQELVSLPSGDGLILSSSKYVSPAGESWNKSGLKPDKEIVSTLEERAGLEPDAQLQKALAYLRPPAAKAA